MNKEQYEFMNKIMNRVRSNMGISEEVADSYDEQAEFEIKGEEFVVLKKEFPQIQQTVFMNCLNIILNEYVSDEDIKEALRK